MRDLVGGELWREILVRWSGKGEESRGGEEERCVHRPNETLDDRSTRARHGRRDVGVGEEEVRVEDEEVFRVEG